MISDVDNGIYYEHAHRLTGMYVGLTVLTLCFTLAGIPDHGSVSQAACCS